MTTVKSTLFVALILVGVGCMVQQIPAGTILPLQLETSLNSARVRVGDRVKARVMQNVPIKGRLNLRAGSKILGRIVSVSRSTSGPSEISLRFDIAAAGKHNSAISTDLRALASPMDVEEAQIPASSPDRGTSEADWVTEQIGGETAYHGSVVTHGNRVVGKYGMEGALVQVSELAGSSCRGDLGNDQIQALWVFSSDACGIYGLRNLAIQHAGTSDPVGKIQLRSESGPVKVPAGSGMLLRVVSP